MRSIRGIESIRCYDPFTAALMIASIGMQAASINENNKNAKKQASALRAEGELKANERAKQTKQLVGRQKASFLNSGISLVGSETSGLVIEDTYKTGLEDISQIRENYGNAASNVLSQARSQMLAGLGNMAFQGASAGVQSGMFSPKTSAQGLAGSSAGMVGTGPGAGFSMATPSGYSGGKTGFSAAGNPFSL